MSKEGMITINLVGFNSGPYALNVMGANLGLNPSSIVGLNLIPTDPMGIGSIATLINTIIQITNAVRNTLDDYFGFRYSKAPV